jgi:hypothetical protein
VPSDPIRFLERSETMHTVGIRASAHAVAAVCRFHPAGKSLLLCGFAIGIILAAQPFPTQAGRDEKDDDKGALSTLTAVSDRGKVVTVKRGSTTLLCYDVTNKNKPLEFESKVKNPRHLALTPDGKLAVIGGGGGRSSSFVSN